MPCYGHRGTGDGGIGARGMEASGCGHRACTGRDTVSVPCFRALLSGAWIALGFQGAGTAPVRVGARFPCPAMGIGARGMEVSGRGNRARTEGHGFRALLIITRPYCRGTVAVPP